VHFFYRINIKSLREYREKIESTDDFDALANTFGFDITNANDGREVKYLRQLIVNVSAAHQNMQGNVS